jgi:hypothetical protein
MRPGATPPPPLLFLRPQLVTPLTVAPVRLNWYTVPWLHRPPAGVTPTKVFASSCSRLPLGAAPSLPSKL